MLIVTNELGLMVFSRIKGRITSFDPKILMLFFLILHQGANSEMIQSKKTFMIFCFFRIKGRILRRFNPKTFMIFFFRVNGRTARLSNPKTFPANPNLTYALNKITIGQLLPVRIQIDRLIDQLINMPRKNTR